MIDAGDIHLADLNAERRHRVLVVSNNRFHRLSRRVLVAPEVAGEVEQVSFPWRVEIDGAVYAVDLMRSIPASCLLERIDRAPAGAMAMVRRVVLTIT